MSTPKPPKLTLIHSLPSPKNPSSKHKSWHPENNGFELKSVLTFKACRLTKTLLLKKSIAEELDGMVKPEHLPLVVAKISELLTRRLHKQDAHLYGNDDCTKTPA